LQRLAVAAGAGGLTGSVLLLVTDEALFSRLVPWLILLACALLGGQKRLRTLLRIGERHGGETPVPAQMVATYAVSIYGGYFGAGLGIMLLAVLGVLFTDPLPRLNAVKQALALVINVTAAIFFAGSGKVVWTFTAVMLPASLLGGVVGGKLVGKVPPGLLRAGIVTFGTILAFWYLLR
jgi:uncharacterized membrane protein YfcA